MRTVSENRVFVYQGVGNAAINPAVCVRNITDYSPFGVSLDGRTIQTDFYRRGFNGMELDDEMKGKGNSYDFGARMYDSRVGRWLTIDPLAGKYPDLSPYNGLGNNPLIYIDVDGRDIVFFDSKGNEERRIVTNTVNITYVAVEIKSIFSSKSFKGTSVFAYVEAKMPNQIKIYSDYENAVGRDYNKYDYVIAAQTFLFNQKRKAGNLPDEGTAGDPQDVPELDPNVVKSILLKETCYGYNNIKNGNIDVMQSNFSGDWSPNKSILGLKKGKTEDFEQSISSGIMWLYWKGVGDPNGTEGKPKWIGGDDWSKAVSEYNGGGDSNYMTKYNLINDCLSLGASVDGAKQFIENVKKSVNDTSKSFFKSTVEKKKKKS